jgi:hypothetical protein
MALCREYPESFSAKLDVPMKQIIIDPAIALCRAYPEIFSAKLDVPMKQIIVDQQI